MLKESVDLGQWPHVFHIQFAHHLNPYWTMNSIAFFFMDRFINQVFWAALNAKKTVNDWLPRDYDFVRVEHLLCANFEKEKKK